LRKRGLLKSGVRGIALFGQYFPQYLNILKGLERKQQLFCYFLHSPFSFVIISGTGKCRSPIGACIGLSPEAEQMCGKC
ncbi:MAG: hypothetical protein IKF39_11435, partial [Oscillospiraceae bacterium]|nr:hypothetical protein [Oscillospiraceae bacterium]